MTRAERRATLSLAAIFALRMIGLFMIMPVFALLGQDLSGASPALIGLAIGIYGLTQAVLQIPFGWLSDRYGRKRFILFGLLLFAVGGVIAALSTSIAGVIIGRAVQGSGAVSGVVMALLADLTRESQRTKAMALIGMSIGASFALAFTIGPWLAGLVGLSGLFWSTTLMALGGFAVCLWLVPEPETGRRLQSHGLRRLSGVLGNTELLRLNSGIFVLHASMTSMFLAMPALLQEAGLPLRHQGTVYLVAMMASLLLVGPVVMQADRRRMHRPLFIASVGVLLLATVWLERWHLSRPALYAGLFVFFAGFNLLEAFLPSLVSRSAPVDARGTAMGLFSSSQFMGAFVGGSVGGLLYGSHGAAGVFLFSAGLVVVWFALAFTMGPVRYSQSYLLVLGPLQESHVAGLARALLAVRGVEEAVIVREESVAYLRVDRELLDERQLRQAAESVPGVAVL